jgi:hypothetical protein
MFRQDALSISESDQVLFQTNGALLLRGVLTEDFLSRFRETVSEWSARLAGAVGLRPHPISSEQGAFDANLILLRNHSPAEAGNLYDAVKKIPLLMQWASAAELVQLASKLLKSSDIGIASRGWGVRIDYPGDNRHRTQLHQEFVSQMCGPRGVVFWTPLRDVAKELGPVIYYPGSHALGLVPMEISGGESRDQRIHNETELRESFACHQPEVAAGDLLILDFLTLHESGLNVGQAARWSLTSRFFDGGAPLSVDMRWRGGIQEGNTVRDLPSGVKEALRLTLIDVQS